MAGDLYLANLLKTVARLETDKDNVTVRLQEVRRGFLSSWLGAWTVVGTVSALLVSSCVGSVAD